MNWKIGQKLVCVDAKAVIGPTRLIEGEIYTHVGLGHICEVGHLVEIINPSLNMGQPYNKCCECCGLIYHGFSHYLPKRFREIVDIGDDVEEYIKSKINEPEYA